MLVSDLDGNGQQDIFVLAGEVGSAMTIFRGLGGRAFSHAATIAGFSYAARAVAVAEATGDGRLDILSTYDVFFGGPGLQIRPNGMLLPIITGQPVAATGCRGESAVFTVAATSPSQPLTHRWRRGGSYLSDADPKYSGVRSDTLVIADLASSDSGLPPYECVLTNLCGSSISAPALISLCLADFNCSGGVSVQDIFDFLGAYFAGSPTADVNGSGDQPTVEDVFDFLIAYFAGCP
jgi:hypothetical protein